VSKNNLEKSQENKLVGSDVAALIISSVEEDEERAHLGIRFTHSKSPHFNHFFKYLKNLMFFLVETKKN
jgi:hypothetical protein